MTEEQIQKLIKQHQKMDVVAWRFWSEDWQYVCDHRMLHRLADDVLIEPLFLAPNKWRGLTDEEISAGMDRAVLPVEMQQAFGAGARWAEAKLKEKNT